MKFRTKLLRVMKLTTAFLLITALHLSAGTLGQTVSYSAKNAKLEKVFSVIEKQTGYGFFYKVPDLKGAKSVSVDLKNAGLKEALEKILQNQSLNFSIEGNTVFITQKPQPAQLFSLGDGIIFSIPGPPPFDVHGVVKDETGNPAVGVSVKIKGTNKGTTTNDNGEFDFKGIDKNATLVFSAVNIETFEIKLNGRPDITVTAKTKVTGLGDITVTGNTGFQTISRERSTGSYNVISGEQLEKPSINIAQRLIGTTAGLLATLDVNGNPIFQIRGLASLYTNPAPNLQTSQPLVVVDGFPIQGDFNSINPNDVESITVLKDAAASSIWGARSANGVIVIVTKKAKKGTPLKVEFDMFTRMGKKFDLDYVNPLASSAATVEYEKIAYTNWRRLQNPSALADYNFAFSQAGTALNEANFGYITATQRDAKLEALKLLDNRRQISDYLLANPVTTQYNINLSSSTERMNNTLSLLYMENQSNFKETSNRQYMVNFRNSTEVFKWMDFNLSGMFQYNKAKNNGVNASITGDLTSPLATIQNMSPYDMLVNPDGSFTDINQKYTPILQRIVPTGKFPYTDWTYNPIQEIQNRDLTTEQINTRIQAGLGFKIIKGLTIDVKGQYELFNTFNRALYNENTYFVRNTVNTATTWNQAVTPNTFTANLPKGGILNQNRTKSQSYNLRGQVNFNRVFFKKHEINFIAGAEGNNILAETFGNPTAYGYNDQNLTVGTFPNGPGGTFFPIKNWLGANQTFAYANTFAYTTERYFSVFGNAAYTYDRKYTVSGSYRTDASNLITDDPKYRYAPFWSVGLGWQIYKEDFMKNASWVDRLNIRATYGYNGNVDRSTSFRPLIATNPTPDVYSGDYTATVSSFGNPTLRWEKTATWNVGMDYSIFNGRLFGKIDVYNKYGKDLIAQLSIPAINGTTSQKLNNAEMTNKGIELELGTYLNISKDITWRGNLNFSYNQNKITKLFVATYSALNVTLVGGTAAYIVGADANSAFKYQYVGLINGEPQVAGAKGVTYPLTILPPGDARDYLVNTGTTVPPYVMGFADSFQVKDFNLSFIVTGKFGHVFQRLAFNYPATWTTRVLPNIKLSEVMNGDPSKIVPLPSNPNYPNYYYYQYSYNSMSYLMENASHLRMQEVNLTYSLPRRLLPKLNISRLMVYAQGNDLFTIYANSAKEDPEYPMGTMKPRPKLTLGIKCEF